MSRRGYRSGRHEPLHVLAGRALIALRALGQVRARVTQRTASILGRLHQRRAHRRYGFACFSDFARETMHMSPRTTKRRLALHRLLDASEPLARAFVTGELSVCKVLALRPVAESDSLPFWIELAGVLSVRELQGRVRDAVSETRDGSEDARHIEHEDAGVGGSVTFATPYSAAVAWDQGMETARRVLGWEAPPHLCVEAILSEAEADLTVVPNAGSVAGDARAAARSARAVARNTDSLPRRAVAPVSKRNSDDEDRLCDTLDLVHRELRALDTLLEDRVSDTHGPGEGGAGVEGDVQGPGAGTDADSTSRDTDHELLARIRALHDTERPLRVLTARLLRDILRARAHHALGYSCLSEFVESELGLSERSGQRLLAEAFLFENEPQLTHAFESGRIGRGQAFLIHRTAWSGTLSAFIDRAGQVTWLQFARELEFLERLAEFAPSIAREFDGPLPLPGLEHALVQSLRERGYTSDAIQYELRSRGLGERAVSVVEQGADRDAGLDGDPAACRMQDVGLDNDPAACPTRMRVLEVLLQLVILAGEGIVAGDGQFVPPTLAPGGRTTTVTFWATDSVLQQWHRSIALARARWGPLPVWAAATLILKHAVDEWERVDPKRRPSEWRILERDDYRCQAPGCSARRRLEVHHIIFRSQDGDDTPENTLTLCHAHHHHGIHDGYIRLTGNAPDDVWWEMGVGGGDSAENRGAFMSLRGSRYRESPALGTST